MMRMPKSISSKDKSSKQAASEAVDELLSEAEQMRRRQDLSDRGRNTLEQLQEDARNLKEYARGKVDHMSEVMREAANSAKESTGFAGGAGSPAVPTDKVSDSVMESLKTVTEKLSAEINDLGERVGSIQARVSESMQAAGGRAADTWHQSSEAAKNVGEREYCLPLPTDRVCARHVAFFGIPLLLILLMFLLRRRYPKKWKKGMDKISQPRMMMSREMPSREQLQGKLSKAADNLEDTAEHAKHRGGALVDEARSQYGKPENKKDQ